MLRNMRNTPNPTHAQELISLRHDGRSVPDILRELYVERGLSQERVAAELGVTRMTVARWLLEHQIFRDDRVSA